jgi:capsid assembly protease
VPRAPRTFQLDRRALAQAHVSAETPLCLARSAWGQTYALAARAPDALELAGEEQQLEGLVAVVRISGPLAQSADELCGWWDGYEGEDGITARFTEAVSAPEVGAVVLAFDIAPGGTSAGLEECGRRCMEARDASGKPVLAYVNVMCASAAYWLAASLATHGIFGPVSAVVGSIGSYIPHESVAGMLEQAGIVETLIADPPGKVAGADSLPLDELGRARLERSVQMCTQRFVAAVAAARGLPEASVRALDGDCLPLELAVEAGLVDGLGSLEDVLSLAASLAALSAPLTPGVA